MNTTPTTVNGTLSHELDDLQELSFGHVRQEGGQASSKREVYPARPLRVAKSRLGEKTRYPKEVPNA
jgi:hypothetical protein